MLTSISGLCQRPVKPSPRSVVTPGVARNRGPSPNLQNHPQRPASSCFAALIPFNVKAASQSILKRSASILLIELNWVFNPIPRASYPEVYVALQRQTKIRSSKSDARHQPPTRPQAMRPDHGQRCGRQGAALDLVWALASGQYSPNARRLTPNSQPGPKPYDPTMITMA